MEEKYICKDCNYTADVSDVCPYCGMPMEPIDAKKIDDLTGEPDKSYDSDELDAVEENNLGPIDKKTDDLDDDFDEIIPEQDDDEEFLKNVKKENEEFHKKEEKKK